MFELETMGFRESNVTELSLVLRNIAIKSKGFSGRALRKLPFLAHALFVKVCRRFQMFHAEYKQFFFKCKNSMGLYFYLK
uniref:Pachytene checkpoint protein 2 C-terminal domain-containing protein n=1 Tax=Hucho hucho TaxID=62062 RepID=A0A4W5PU10_9TELE